MIHIWEEVDMPDYSQDFLKLLELQKKSPITDGSESFIIDPDTGTMKTTYRGKPMDITIENPAYTATLLALSKHNKPALDTLTVTPPSEYVKPQIPMPFSPDGLYPTDPSSKFNMVDILTMEDTSPAFTPATTKEEVEKASLLNAQQKNLALTLGPAAFAGALQGGLGLIQKTEQDKYAEKELKQLQERRKAGELGLTPQEQSLLLETQMSPARALAREARLRQEAAQSAGGVQTSAASQMAAKEAQTTAIAEAGRKAGLTMSQAQMAKADQELKKLESLTAYKGQRQQQRREAAWAGASDFAQAIGLAAGAGAVKAPDKVGELFDIANLNKVDLSTDDLVRMNSRLTNSPYMSDLKFDSILKSYDIDPKTVTLEQRKMFYS